MNIRIRNGDIKSESGISNLRASCGRIDIACLGNMERAPSKAIQIIDCRRICHVANGAYPKRLSNNLGAALVPC